jgi:hypothetical protein
VFVASRKRQIKAVASMTWTLSKFIRVKSKALSYYFICISVEPKTKGFSLTGNFRVKKSALSG